ncbi:MAG TPA: hypothetical protein VE338_10530 [Ktedonobacterales bacterium]|nr:hypothetical protein [Ktedonobacterales bacterium]
MIAEGLLWFDDDPRRPVAEKIAGAVERYSERTGWRPTVCEAHPTQVDVFNADRARAEVAAQRRRSSKAKAAPSVELPANLRITASLAMRPNYFLIGIEAGERPRKAAAQPSPQSAARKAKRAAASAAASGVAVSTRQVNVEAPAPPAIPKKSAARARGADVQAPQASQAPRAIQTTQTTQTTQEPQVARATRTPRTPRAKAG